MLIAIITIFSNASAGEEVAVLFKFQSFANEGTEPRRIKISFLAKTRKPVAVLNMAVQPGPLVVDQTFRFWCPENQFMKQTIRLPPQRLNRLMTGTDGAQGLFVRCNNADVVCDCRPVVGSDPQDILVKFSCGPTPSVTHFYLFLYEDAYLAHPVHIWKLSVHALERVDMVR